tara:strand:- start:4959 stop:6002 length:1044 start_codon:yes stop_codon:yes gene_type:complete
MAADVLTYNAIQEINQELKAEAASLQVGITSAAPATDSSSSSDCIEIVKGAGAPNTGLWCMIPQTAAAGGTWTGGFKVCETSTYRRCNAQCTWTVPGGVTCARFQIWGAGGGSGTSCCCGGSPNAGSGAYASVIIPVTAGDSYNLCAGCAYCCYTERSQMTQDGQQSYVTGTGLTNFCAEGGESNIMCEVKTRQQCVQNLNDAYCMWMGSCICNTGTDYCSHNTETGGVAYPEGYRDAHYQSTASCKTYFGEATTGDVWGVPGQFSYAHYDHGSNNFCVWSPGVYGFPTESCCCYDFHNDNGGCCYQACYCAHQIPGAGAFGYSTCGGDTNGCADIGRMGMVCVSYL